MALKVSMPSVSGYVSSSQNLSNMANILSNRRKAEADRQAAVDTKIFRQQQLAQGDARLSMQQEAQDWTQGADARAVTAEQAIFDLNRTRTESDNRDRNDLLSSVANDPSNAYNMNRQTINALENAPGAFNPVFSTAPGTAENLDALLDNEELVTGFEDQMKANPQLFQDPTKLKLDVARLARESGRYSEEQIKAMQATATENFPTLSADAQAQLHDEQKTILESGSKIFGKGSNNVTNNFGTGSNGYNVAATGQPTSQQAFDTYSEALGVDQSKSGLKWLSEAVTPETFFGMFEMNSPDMSIDELKKVTAFSQLESGVGPSHTMEAMRSLGYIRGDGTFKMDVSDMMSDPGVMLDIKNMALSNQAAAAAKKNFGGTSNTVANAAGMDTLLSNFNQSNNAIRAGGSQTKTPLSEILKKAKDYVAEQTGVPSDTKPVKAKGTSGLAQTGNTITTAEEDELTSLLNGNTTPTSLAASNVEEVIQSDDPNAPGYVDPDIPPAYEAGEVGTTDVANPYMDANKDVSSDRRDFIESIFSGLPDSQKSDNHKNDLSNKKVQGKIFSAKEELANLPGFFNRNAEELKKGRALEAQIRQLKKDIK